ncbi:MAG: peptide ABC transporter substrate-binding protein [Clostridium sp.]|uniref:peptide ABC transporter substrate-binding protein n=1 Tax=Clostridium sp. TaxID=1506 RepID=UPI003F38C720
MILRKRGIAMLLTTIVAGTMLAGCGGTDKKGGSTDKTLKLAWTSDIKLTDPTHAYDGATKDLLANIMEGLFMLDDKDQAEKALAEDVKFDEKTNTYTFKIKEGVKWFKTVEGKAVETGDVVDAEDFEYAWKRQADPKTGSQQAQFLNYAAIKNYDKISKGELKPEELGVKALDKYTLEVQLERAVPYFESLLAMPSFYPISEEFVEEVEKGGKTFGTSIDTTIAYGPFIMSEWRTDELINFNKNDEYWDAEKVGPDKVEIVINKDTASTKNLYEAGDIHKIGLSSQDAETYKDSEEFVSTLGSAVTSLKFNMKSKAVQNVNLRKAMSMAIDKEQYVNSVLKNGSKVATGIIPEGFTFDKDGKDFREGYAGVNFKLDEAEKAWAQAKKELGDKIEVELLLTDSDGDKKNGEYLQSQLEKNLPGLKVKIKQVPFKNRLDLEASGKYDVVLATYGLNYTDPVALLELWTSDSSINNAFYNSPKYDELVKKAKAEQDPAKRWQMLLDAEKQFVEVDVVKVPITQGAKTFLISNDIEGYRINKTAYADVWKTAQFK